MNHIKPYNIFESQEPQHPEHPGFPEKEEEIHELCEKFKLKDYIINDDLSINFDGSVTLSYYNINHIPLNFNYVGGFFLCNDNRLKSLKGCPNEVGGRFDCSENRLKSLKYSPKKVGSKFTFNNNFYISSLKGGPEKINGAFVSHNNNLLSLNYLPRGIDFSSYYTKFYNNPIYIILKIIVDYVHEENNIEDLIQEFNDYDIVRDNKVILNRLKVFCSDFDLYMPNMDEVEKYYEIV